MVTGSSRTSSRSRDGECDCGQGRCIRRSTDFREEELIAVDREEVVDSLRLRRYYRLTPTGEETLAEEAARLHSNARAAMLRLDPSGGMAST